MLRRPSNREIGTKVAEALDALIAGRFQFGTRKHIAADLEGLGIETADLPALLIVLLEEIRNAGPIQCYAGTRPPQRSYEPEILGLELWAYSWHSPLFQKPMYLKFALKRQCYVYVDCHEDRPPEGLI